MTEREHTRTARAVYDVAAAHYAREIGTQLGAAFEGPVDRAVLAAFVEMVGVPGTVADVGCGPGRAAAFLAARGVDVVGIDVSATMLAIARDAHPGIPFENGSLDAIPRPGGSLDGVVCWYSIIHTPPAYLDDVFAELVRVLNPGGSVLLAFQAGDGAPVHRDDAYGTGMPLDSYRHSPDAVIEALTRAGLRVHARVLRDPEFDHESTPQAFIIARRFRGNVAAPE